MLIFFQRYWFAIFIIAAILGIYIPGLDNALLFDDSQLQYGNIFTEYGNLLHFKQRMLSYSSFIWTQDIFGAGWWKQRVFNIVVHIAVVAAIYALMRQLLAHTHFPTDITEQTHFAASRHAATIVALVFFALHPMAVYAVAYLIQRSILMATLFTIIACWAWVRGLESRQWLWYIVAIISYILAVASKEYAIMAVVLSIPLYVYIRRPRPQAIAMIALGSFLILGITSAVFYYIYSSVLGKPFDPQSVAYTQQLEALHPGFTQAVYPLSILNELRLFFAYGLRWFVPYVGWMSVDMRPAFPVGFFEPLHVLGAVSYMLVLGTSLWLLLRRHDTWSFIGLLCLFPAILFWTEFSTVWIQDPFVLYRSYLWAAFLPGFLAVLLTGLQPRTIYIIGLILGCVLGFQAFDRVVSLKNETTAWQDVIDKTDLQAPVNAVGRSRAYINLGNYQLKNNEFDFAERNLKTAISLNDPGHTGAAAHLNLGTIYEKTGRHALALESLDAAEKMGYPGISLHFYRGQALFGLGRFAQSQASFHKALIGLEHSPQNRPFEPRIRHLRAEAAMKAEQYDIAIEEYRTLLTIQPENAVLLRQSLAAAQRAAAHTP